MVRYCPYQRRKVRDDPAGLLGEIDGHLRYKAGKSTGKYSIKRGKSTVPV